MEEAGADKGQASFYKITEWQGSTVTTEPIPDEWYGPDNLSDRSFLSNFLTREFNADQWLKYFTTYASSNSRRALKTALLHHIRTIIIEQTMDWCKRGFYPLPPTTGGVRRKVEFDVNYLHSEIRKTTAYRKCPTLPPATEQHETEVLVYEGDCIEAGRWLQLQGYNPLVLNMANQTQPGGGYRHGAGAQEENLHRRSNYFESLEDPRRIQQDGGRRNYPIAETGAIYSPKIVVFRASEAKGYAYLEEPYLMSFIACAALAHPPLLYSKEKGFFLEGDSADVMKEKIRTMLAVGVINGHDSMVLSAFGCGAFCCPPSHVAELFKEVIESEEFAGRFKRLLFAIFDDHNARRQHNPEGNVKPFVDVFKNKLEI